MEALGSSPPPTHCGCSRSAAGPSWGAVTAAEELLQHCRDGAGRAGHGGRAHSSRQWRGERGRSGLCLFSVNTGRWWEVGWKLEESFLSVWMGSSSQLPLQLWFNKNRFAMLMLQKAPVLHSRAGQGFSFISIFYGKGEHSELMCRLWCPWWK